MARRLSVRTGLVLLALVCAGMCTGLLAQGARQLSYGSPASVGMDQAALDKGVELLRQAVARDELRGAVLMVARHGTVVLHEALGWRHHGYRLPMEKDTLFRMASNTKPVVATAVMILQQDGKLKVEDRAGQHLPSFDTYRSREITIAELLSHTSGLRIGPIFYPFDREEKKDGQKGETPTLQGAVAKFGEEGPLETPGATFSYSNAGFNTLGAIIEKASGLPLEAFLKSRIYDPLGMTDSLNHEDPAKLARMATVYRGEQVDGKVEWTQGFVPDDPPDFPVVRASGGLISTAMDYGRFLQMFLNGGVYGGARVLTPESIAAMTAPHANAGTDGSYGYGWFVAAGGVYWHSGSDGTYAWVDPAHDLLGLVFTQSPGGINPREEFRKIVTEACR